ncbi:hypothetical protein [Tatumella saanichensis]|nr:hypothetical protein [Tatumella saanichensis]
MFGFLTRFASAFMAVFSIAAGILFYPAPVSISLSVLPSQGALSG